MNQAEQAILDYAPVGSLWWHRYTPDPLLLVCTGPHADWRDPADWAEGVEIEPVVWLGRADDDGNPTGADRGTVTLRELRDSYDRVHKLEEAAPGRTLENREKRRAKIERVKTDAVQFLLDGLEVESIVELKRLVDAARNRWAAFDMDEVALIHHALRMLNDLEDDSTALADQAWTEITSRVKEPA